MWWSNLYPTEASTSSLAPAGSLPVCTEPMPEESLASWLSRLAERVGMSPLAFTRYAFGIDSRFDVEWWRRASEEQIAVIGARTGIDAKRLRSMTMADWSMARADERQRRLDAQRVRRRPAQQMPDNSMTVCSCCLEEDEQPYIRRQWMIGWLAVCPRHKCLLIRHCPVCSSYLRAGDLGRRDIVRVGHCYHCGARLGSADVPLPAEAVTELQDRLMRIKRNGAGELPGLGLIDWATFTAVADLVLTAMWVETKDYKREMVFGRIIRDLGMPPDMRLPIEWQSNYGTLLTLAWMFADWPSRLERTLYDLQSLSVENIVDRLLDMDEALRNRLLHLLGTAGRYRRSEVDEDAWREWLNGIVATGLNFRAMARQEMHQGYSIRVSVLAMLSEGYSIAEAAAWARLTPERIRRWLETAMVYGICFLKNPCW